MEADSSWETLAGDRGLPKARAAEETIVASSPPSQQLMLDPEPSRELEARNQLKVKGLTSLHDSPKVQTAGTPVGGRMDGHRVPYLCSGMGLSQEKERGTGMGCRSMRLESITRKERSQAQKATERVIPFT